MRTVAALRETALDEQLVEAFARHVACFASSGIFWKPRRAIGYAPLVQFPRARRVRGAWPLALTILAACRIGFDDLSRDGAPVEAGAPIDGSDGCDLTMPFGAPVLITELSDPANDDGTLRLFADELTGYYWATKSGITNIYFAQRTSLASPFTSTPVADLNTTTRQLDPTVSSDGSLIVFRRNVSGDHLYVATRTGPTSFGTAVPVDMVDTGSDQQPYLRPDSNELIFSSARQGAGTDDLYRTTHNGTTFVAPTRIDELAVKMTRAGDPVITADGLTIYFRSDRPGSAAGFNIWVAHRDSTAATFDTPTELTQLDSSGDEGPSDVSRDGCRIYLSSNRAGSNDIYVASRPPK